MNYKLVTFALLISVFLCGCLGFEFYSIKLNMYDDKSNEITVQMKNIFSTEDSLKKQQEDFISVINDFYRGDKFLLDQVDEGIYVKERKLFEKDGKLVFEFKGIFRDFKIDKDPLKKVDGKWKIALSDPGEYQLHDTNGEITDIEGIKHIIWPAETNNLYLEFALDAEEKDQGTMHSLVPFYNNWKKGKLKIPEY